MPAVIVFCTAVVSSEAFSSPPYLFWFVSYLVKATNSLQIDVVPFKLSSLSPNLCVLVIPIDILYFHLLLSLYHVLPSLHCYY